MTKQEGFLTESREGSCFHSVLFWALVELEMLLVPSSIVEKTSEPLVGKHTHY